MPAIPENMRIATMRRRAFAALLDHILAFFLASVLTMPLLSLRPHYLVLAAFQTLVFFFYFVLLTGFFQRTVGKMLLGLWVVEVKERKRAGWGRIIQRELLGRFLCMYLSPLGYVTVRHRDSKGQTLADLVAGTVVLHRRK